VKCYNDQCANSPEPFNDFGHKQTAIAAWNLRTTTPANAARLTAEDVALIDRAARDFPRGPANLWAHNYGPRLIALARLASTPAPDTGDAMVEALRKHVATLADELEYALRDRYHLMLGYPEIERRFIREMASVIEAREALAVSRAPVQG